MNSLQYLNGISDAAVTYTDNRNPDVLFDRAGAKSYEFIGLETTFNIVVGINIVEIIKPEYTNIRYSVNAGTTQATVVWPVLPARFTIWQIGTVFYVTGIASVEDWELVKSPQIILDEDFFGNVNYSGTITYDKYTQANNTVTWDVGQYVPSTLMVSSFDTSIEAFKIVDPELQFYSVATIGKFQAVFATTAFINSSSSMSVDFEIVQIASANINAAFTQISYGNKTADFESTRPSFTAMYTTAYDYRPILQLSDKAFNGNSSNTGILSGVYIPNIPFYDDTVDVYTITLTSPDGEFGTTTSSSSLYSFTGTWQEVNTNFANIVFYPDRDFASNTTLTYTQSKQGSYSISRTINLTYAGEGVLAGNTYTFTSSTTWLPSIEDTKYLSMDIFLVGGGGASEDMMPQVNSAGNGGGAGEVLYVTNALINQSSYNVSIGAGGIDLQQLKSNAWISYQGPNNSAGANGSATSVGSYIANGGYGGLAKFGRGFFTNDGSNSLWVSDLSSTGGADGSGVYIGGDNCLKYQSSFDYQASQHGSPGQAPYASGGISSGGGGGGSSGNGLSGGVVGNDNYLFGGRGGNGTLCPIDNVTYAYGGAGGSIGDSDTQPNYKFINNGYGSYLPAHYTTPGSGGKGRDGNYGGSSGQNGIVIIKTHI